MPDRKPSAAALARRADTGGHIHRGPGPGLVHRFVGRAFRQGAPRAASRALLLLQLAATAAVLGWVPGNLVKLAAMLAIWAIGFR
ncbi:MAG: hypothetical protein ACREEZ_08220, partial [Stellaceae bacterium]